MTREEEIKNAKKTFYERIYEEGCYYDPRDCFEEGAEWADEHPINMWHDASEIPKENTWVLAEFNEMNYETFFMCPLGGASCCKDVNLTRWAYISDLLPKGGEK